MEFIKSSFIYLLPNDKAFDAKYYHDNIFYSIDSLPLVDRLEKFISFLYKQYLVSHNSKMLNILC
jgi:hypothetical protein